MCHAPLQIIARHPKVEVLKFSNKKINPKMKDIQLSQQMKFSLTIINMYLWYDYSRLNYVPKNI